MVISLIILIIGIVLISIAKKKIKITDDENKRIAQELTNLNQEKARIQKDIQQDRLVSEHVRENLRQMQDTASYGFSVYHDELELQYQEAEREQQEALDRLRESYSNTQTSILEEIEANKEELAKISATREAAIKAQLKEQEIREKEFFYSLSLDEIDLHEAKVLRSIESELRDPRPVKMIIWSTYYSKRANDLAARVLGTGADVSGIYKITNKLSGISYVGQARNIRERWREHMKCGLGIDTPSNNKLYQDMIKDGIDNFTFELLEACPIAQLDEKERFYINLYQTKEFGYNNTGGNKR